MSRRDPSKRSGRRPGRPRTREADRRGGAPSVRRARLRARDDARDRERGRRRRRARRPLLRLEGRALPRGHAACRPRSRRRSRGLADGPRATVGRRLAEAIVGMLENPGYAPIIVGRIRSAVLTPEAAALVRETVTRDIGRLVAAADRRQPETRAVLVGAQIVGLALARYVVRVEPLASLPGRGRDRLHRADLPALPRRDSPGRSGYTDGESRANDLRKSREALLSAKIPAHRNISPP